MNARSVLIFFGLAVGGCVHGPPRIDDVAGAPPQPNQYWNGPAPKAPEPPSHNGASSEALQGLTVSRVVDLALRNNPATRVSWAQARSAADVYGAAHGQLFPSLTGSETFTNSRALVVPGTKISPERNQWGPSLNLSYLVLDFGGRAGAIEDARETAISADFTHNSTIQNTILQAETAVFGYLGTRALRDAQRAAVSEAAANLAAAEERHRVGLATIADVLQARTAYSQAQLDLETLEGSVQIAHGTLANAMGIPVTSAFDVAGVQAVPPTDSLAAVNASIDSLITAAERARPDLAASRAGALAAAAQVRVARSNLLPSLSLTSTGGYTQTSVPGFNGPTYTLNLGLSVPIFTGFTQQYDLLSASDLLQAANARAESLRQQTDLQVLTSYYGLKTSTDRLRTSADLLASAQQSDSVARGRYREGVGTFVDLLLAQSALETASAQAVQAQWQWRQALAQLAHDAGLLGLHGEPLGPLGPGNRDED